MSSILAVLIILSILGYWVFSSQTPAVPADGSAVEASSDAVPAVEPTESSTVPATEAVDVLELDPLEVSVEGSVVPVLPDSVDDALLSTPQEGTSN